jgi:hypothetical protein
MLSAWAATVQVDLFLHPPGEAVGGRQLLA